MQADKNARYNALRLNDGGFNPFLPFLAVACNVDDLSSKLLPGFDQPTEVLPTVRRTMAHHVFETARLAVQDISRPVARSLGIAKLPDHAHVVVASTLSFFAIHLVVAPIVSKALFPRSYGQLKTRKARSNWNNRIVSLVHALIVIPLSFKNLYLPALDVDRAFGWDPRQGTLSAISSGYFIWDTFESILHFTEIGFVLHGFSCFCIYLLSLKPFIAYYGPRFLLWELSTPFLNIHWFLDKMNLTGSTIQLVNGFLLLTSFAGVRLVYGSIQSYAFYRTLFSIKDQVPLVVILIYGVGNVILNGLNVFWFSKMISALQKRMKPSPKGNGTANGVANGDAKKSD